MSGETPTSTDALRAEIAQTRAELGDTAAALAAKTDVKSRLKTSAVRLAGRATSRAGVVRDRARAAVTSRSGDRSGAATSPTGGLRDQAGVATSRAGSLKDRAGRVSKQLAGQAGRLRERMSGGRGATLGGTTPGRPTPGVVAGGRGPGWSGATEPARRWSPAEAARRPIPVAVASAAATAVIVAVFLTRRSRH